LLLLVGGLVAWWLWPSPPPATPVPPAPVIIKIGVIVSRTGPHALEAEAIIDGANLACDELNEQGAQLQVIIVDGEGDPAKFAALARKLIEEDKVHVLIGCWTAEERKAVVPMVQKSSILLLYPAPFEGLEPSANVVYFGPHPQHLVGAARSWCADKKEAVGAYVIGTTSRYSTMTHLLLNEALIQGDLPATIVGESWGPAVKEAWDLDPKLDGRLPSCVFICVDGPARSRTLKEYKSITGDVPAIFFGVTEHDVLALVESHNTSVQLVSSVVPGQDFAKQPRFLKRWQAKHGKRLPGPIPVNTYCGLHLWFLAKRSVGDGGPAAQRKALAAVGPFDGPAGLVSFDDKTGFAVRSMWLSQLTADGAFVKQGSWDTQASGFGRRESAWEGVFAKKQ
jgi:urea transport system substrate-binding protein